MSPVSPEPLPCYLLTGILGSGKTTLLNHILHRTGGRRFAVIVNELGAIDVDGELIEAGGSPQLSLPNGCICCTINQDLESTVVDFLKQNSGFDGLIVEASGVADPQPVVNTFILSDTLRSLTRIHSVVAVIDCEAFSTLRGQHAFLARRQAAASDLTLLNKSDLVTPEKLAAVRKSLEDWVPRLRTATCTQAEIPLELLLDEPRFQPDQMPPGEPVEVHLHGPGMGCSHHHSVNQLALTSWTFEARGRFRSRALASVLKNLPPAVYRAKGFVCFQDDHENVFSVQLSGTRLDIRPTTSDIDASTATNRLVFISEENGFDVQDLTRKLEEAMEEKEETDPSQVLLEKVKRALGG